MVMTCHRKVIAFVLLRTAAMLVDKCQLIGVHLHRHQITLTTLKLILHQSDMIYGKYHKSL